MCLSFHLLPALTTDVTSAVLQLYTQSQEQLSPRTGKLVITSLNKQGRISFVEHIKQKLEEKTGSGKNNSRLPLLRTEKENTFSTHANSLESRHHQKP